MFLYFSRNCRVLSYRIELISSFMNRSDDMYVRRILGISLLTFLGILLLSNVITSLSTFFLSQDLEYG